MSLTSYLPGTDTHTHIQLRKFSSDSLTVPNSAFRTKFGHNFYLFHWVAYLSILSLLGLEPT